MRKKGEWACLSFSVGDCVEGCGLIMVIIIEEITFEASVYILVCGRVCFPLGLWEGSTPGQILGLARMT